MSNSPQIPDSVSADMLRGLLGKSMPTSAVIPSLDFGGKLGAPCDLQFAVAQIVAQSVAGVNIIQILIAAMHLLSEVQLYLDDRLERIKTGDDTLEGATEGVKAEILAEMKRQCAAITSATVHIESMVQALAPVICQTRIDALVRSGEVAPGVTSTEQLASYLLVSSELLDSLGIKRSDITQFLANHS